MNKIISLLFLLAFSAEVHSQVPKEKLLIDYDFLVQELRVNHQGLYQYVEKEIVDQKIDSIRNTIEATDKVEFFKKVSALIALTNEGHSGAEPSFWTKTKLGLSKSFIPIGMEFSDKKVILTKYYSKHNPGLEFGDQILSINGNTLPSIMQNLKPYIVTDGFNETSFYEWVSWEFPLQYALAYGKHKTFKIKIKKYDSKEIKTFTINATSLPKIKDEKNRLNTVKRPSDFEYKTIADSIGYLSIPDFYSHEDFQKFYLESFTEIKKKNIKHLIIDVQENVGGAEGNENLLVSYLIKEPFQKYEKVLAPRNLYDNFKNDKSDIEDGWSIVKDIPHRGKFTLMSDYYSNFNYKKPQQELVYTGKVYVLTSGVTFSGGAEFSSMLKMTDRALFIGEETGGTYEGNVSGYDHYVKLPNTKIKVKIPIVHYKINVKPEQPGLGVIPDYKVFQKWSDIVKGKNSKFEFALNLIRENNE
ncbi:MAG: S41 family peptidase [Phaeodactylibacter sp.]|uniref:S41 family peptidase n=1 Tax=Phaeodactylibacter sp. TaxID=1940289 RepID=UPI0032EE2DEB